MKKKIFIVITITLLILIFSILLCTKINKISLIENIKQTIAKIEEKTQSTNEVTTKDVTNLEDNGNLEHEHIYKTQYNETKHWEECIVCGERLNENTHIYEKKYLGVKGLCGINNGWINSCICGYSFSESKPCIWSGQYNINSYYHYKRCTNGHLEKGVQCHLADGTLLNCKKGGICSECKTKWSTGLHGIEEENGSLKCFQCGENYGNTSVEVIRERTIFRYIYYNCKT